MGSNNLIIIINSLTSNTVNLNLALAWKPMLMFDSFLFGLQSIQHWSLVQCTLCYDGPFNAHKQLNCRIFF